LIPDLLAAGECTRGFYCWLFRQQLLPELQFRWRPPL